ncbi:MAG: hypothetical protein H7Y43_00015, partial [Akkermansiaceae bacterium]|nr:hypothetical protein [Verrucomicrobiales bacterium]
GIDAGFTTGSGVNNAIKGIGLQSDGKLIVGGQFSSYQGVAANRLMRLAADGTRDTNFTIGTGPNGDVTGLVVQSNDKMVIIGGFTTYNGAAASLVARLNLDGTRDTNFNPNVYNFGANTLAVQSDGKVLLGGLQFFRSDFQISRYGIVRLNTNGLMETSYNTNNFNGEVHALAVQPDGNVIAGGRFSFAGRTNIVRLDTNGVVDPTFNPSFAVRDVFQSVNSLALQPDGKIVLGGLFENVGSVMRTNLARLNADGTDDTNFNNINLGGAIAGKVNAVLLQPNGKIIVGGIFGTVNGLTYNRLARFDTNGVLDAQFIIGAGANDEITDLLLQPDGKIWLAGLFTTFDGKPRVQLARIYGDAPPPAAPLIASPILSGTSFSCTVSTVVGLTYTLEYKDALSDSMWSFLPPVAGDGTVKTLIDPTSTGSNRFYRVRVD